MFIRRLLFILPLLVLLGSCQKIEKAPKPKNLIPEDKMVEILVDLAKVDAAISLSSKEYEKRGEMGKKLILEKHQIDSLQLIESSHYYAENFKLNERIYEKASAILKKESDSLSKLDDELKREASAKRAAEAEQKEKEEPEQEQ